MTDSFEKIARDAFTSLLKAIELLNQADDLMASQIMGTEKWVDEVKRWRRRKDAIADCGRNPP